MACNKKVVTYGSKKVEREQKQWDALDSETSKSNVILGKTAFRKKGVWAKVPHKSSKESKSIISDTLNDPFSFIDDDEAISPGLEKPKMPTSSFYGSAKTKFGMKSPRMEGKTLPADPVTINAEDLKHFGSPRKNIKTENNHPESKLDIDSTNEKITTESNNFEESFKPLSCSVDEHVSPSPQHKKSIKAMVRLSPSKIKPINIEPVVKVTKMGGKNCSKNGLDNNVVSNHIKAEKENQIDVQLELEVGAIPVEFIDDNTVLVIRQKDLKMSENKKKKKNQKNTSKRSNMKDVKQMPEDGNIFNIFEDGESKESHSDMDIESKRSQTPDLDVERKSQNPDLDVESFEELLLLERTNNQLSIDSVVSKKNNITNNKEEDQSVHGVPSETVNAEYSDSSEDDVPLQKLCDQEENVPLVKLCSYENVGEDSDLQKLKDKSPFKKAVTRKRSLFSYYDNKGDSKGSKTCSVSSDELGDSQDSNADLDILDSNIFDEPSDDIDGPISKKVRIEDVSQSEISDKDVSTHLTSVTKSPFKSKWNYTALKQHSSKQSSSVRRYSSLPTDITLQNNDDDDDLEDSQDSEEIKTPPPLYRSSIFGFRKSIGTSSHKVRVPREEKHLYTVVRNTKNAHECMEYGQTQQFKDDLEYLLDGLKSSQNAPTRCLSALELALKCISSDFRMYMKAHGLAESVFTMLGDAFADGCLMVCASVVLYVLAKGKVKINFDKIMVTFLLRVLTEKKGLDEKESGKVGVSDKIRKKIKSILEKVEDVDMHLLSAIELVDAPILAREALLLLTVKMTGEWFRTDIRELGGLDDIADTIYACSQCIIQKKDSIDKSCNQMKSCLGLFSDMTYKCTANQAYLLTCRNSVVIESCIRTLNFITCCYEGEIPTLLAECLMAIQLLLMNLSHENKNASVQICKQENGLDSILHSALHLAERLPSKMSYENTIVSLCLLINLIADHPSNRLILNKKTTNPYYLATMKKPTDNGNTTMESAEERGDASAAKCLTKTIEVFLQMFLVHSEACKEGDLMEELEKLEQEERDIDANMHYEEDENALTCGDKFEDTVEDISKDLPQDNNLDGPLNEKEKMDIKSTLDKAVKHMEDSHLSAYTGLLIGILMEDDDENQKFVHSLLPDGDFTALRDSIEKILNFMEMTNPLCKSDQDCMRRIMQIVSNCNDKFNKEKG